MVIATRRQELQNRVMDARPTFGLHGSELVEYLVSLAEPRTNARKTAERLIYAFGSIGHLLSADAQTIATVGNVSVKVAAALKVAHAAATALLAHHVDKQDVISSQSALRDYLRASMGHRPVEQVRILYLNVRNGLIRDEVFSEGTVDECVVYVREVVRRSLEYNAAAIIIVHNHPSGIASPSRQDIRLTGDIIKALKPLNIAVHDHIIVSPNGEYSMRYHGHL